MRGALALLALLLLGSAPVLAQKSKAVSTQPDVGASAIAAVEACEEFASGRTSALDAVIAQGWDAYDQGGESPFVKSYGASKDLPGIGMADLFALVESYPQTGFGYCRIDVPVAAGPRSAEAVTAVRNLPRYEGSLETTEAGTFASLTENEAVNTHLLLTHWTADSFVVQLTIVTPKPAEGKTP